MKTEAYVERGKWVMGHIAPINTVMAVSTAAFIPLLGALHPYFPYIDYMAGLAALVFLVLLVMKVLGIPRGKQLQTSIVIYSGVCAIIFSVGAIASTRHADQGGTITAGALWVTQLQQTLLNIEDDKNDDPRAELRNMNVEWAPDNLF